MENGKLTFEEIIEQANQILDFLKNLKTEVEQKQKENETLLSLNDNLRELIKDLELNIESIINLLDQISQLDPEKITNETQRISDEISNLYKSSESLNQEIRSFFKNHSAEVSNSLNAFDEKLNSFRNYYNQRLDDLRNVLVQQILQSDLKNQKNLNVIQNEISSFHNNTTSNFVLLNSKLDDSLSNFNNIISKSTQQNQENLAKVNEDLQTKLELISHNIQVFQDNFNENKIAGHKTIKNLRKLIIISLIVSSLALIISLINIFR
jgi:uncharacterized phage infection (PIP) family protein YhgE